MKKVLLTGILMAGLASASFAQKGSILVLGNVDFSSTKSAAGNKASSFEILPSVGYQFNNNWTAGLSVGVGSDKTTPTVGASTTVNSFSFGPFLRYTQPLAGAFSWFGQLDANFGSSKVKGSSVTTNTFVAQITPAILVNVKNGFAFNVAFGGLQYNTSKVKGANSSSNGFGLTFGQSMNFGISKNFGGSKK